MKNIPITENRINIRPLALQILHTIQDLEKPYGFSYIAQILGGKSSFGWKDQAHTSLSSFGSLQENSRDRIQRIYSFLLRRGFIEILEPAFGTIGLTKGGFSFLNNPHDLWVNANSLKCKSHDKRLMVLLKRARLSISRQEGRAPYQIFNDHTLDCLVEAKPENVLQLKRIPGMTDHKVDEYGHLLLKEIRFVLLQKKRESQSRKLRQAQSQSLLRIKALFQAGYSIEEIASHCQIKATTVRGYLFVLHDADEIDLIPWIEKNIPEDSLRIGTTYFKEVDQPRLKEAYQILGLDYETLRFCRLYVSQISADDDELLLP